MQIGFNLCAPWKPLFRRPHSFGKKRPFLLFWAASKLQTACASLPESEYSRLGLPAITRVDDGVSRIFCPPPLHPTRPMMYDLMEMNRSTTAVD